MTITNQQRQELKSLIQKLEGHQKTILGFDPVHNQNQYFEAMAQFRQFLASVTDEKLCDLLYHSEKYAKLQKFFFEQNDYYMRALEAVEAMVVLRNHISHDADEFLNLLEYDYNKKRYEAYSTFYKNLELKDIKKMVMVGCGPLPNTIMYFYENTKIPEIIGLDNNQEAVFMAGTMLKGLECSGVKLRHMDGTKYDYSEADVITIANFVSPKNKVLNRIASTCKDSAQIVVESPRFLNSMIFDKIVKEKLHPRLKVNNVTEVDYGYTKNEIFFMSKYDL